MHRIYLDHAATTPMRPEALAAVAEGMERWANPSSPHAEGRKARVALEDARDRIRKELGWSGEVILTSGASEAAWLALNRACAVKGNGSGSGAGTRFVSAVEHDAVHGAAPDATMLLVAPDGSVDLEPLSGGASPIVAMQAINSETGAAQDMQAVADRVHAAGGLLVADCAQSAAKYPLPSECDMAIISAHKLGGPPGIGALLVRDYAMLAPAGGQERGYRRGTENLPAALGFAAALEQATQPFCPPDVLAALERLAVLVRGAGGVWLSDRLARPTPLIHGIAMPNLSGSAQLMRFDMAGFAVSLGSACSSGSLKGSHVLKAMQIEDDLASRIIRISVGWSSSAADVEAFTARWLAMATDVQ
ncbi:aminotransferase class V-fold PLP-dependent enzyme [Altererythrobacter sp. SALINAS58]|nr:aminotransferase class V-fold PLP-dependent enzyme [Alteripontixanthobacter muriae]